MPISSLKPFKLSKRLKSLPQSFYERDTTQVARDLLGKVLVVRSAPRYALDDPRAQVTAARIVETEAYHGTDPASHCAKGETPRCAIMFGKPGVAYVYFIYGMYEMLNFVTERKGYPGAVLIRAVEPLHGNALMQKRRVLLAGSQWTNGPGRLCQALGIELIHNGQSLKGPELFVVEQGFEPEQVSVSPRVGISKGTEQYWRFFITGNRFVGKSPLNKLAKPLLESRLTRSVKSAKPGRSVSAA